MITPQVLMLLFLVGIGSLVLGYAARGAIRREANVPRSEGAQLADRLEDAARGDAGELESAIETIIEELRSKG